MYQLRNLPANQTAGVRCLNGINWILVLLGYLLYSHSSCGFLHDDVTLGVKGQTQPFGIAASLNFGEADCIAVK